MSALTAVELPEVTALGEARFGTPCRVTFCDWSARPRARCGASAELVAMSGRVLLRSRHCYAQSEGAARAEALADLAAKLSAEA